MRSVHLCATWLTVCAIALVFLDCCCADDPRPSEPINSAVTFPDLQRRLDAQDAEIARLRFSLEEALAGNSLPPPPTPAVDDSAGSATLAPSMNHPSVDDSAGESNQTTGEFTAVGTGNQFGLNLNAFDSAFNQGIVIRSNNMAMKIGGYVKVDVIHDFDPIADEYAFNTQTILVNAVDRQNSKIHARQSRLNFDTRWNTDYGTVRAFVEGDFFGNGNSFQLRHAYGEVGPLIVGQTWSTFANVRALPPTLDYQGSASVITQRQGQVRLTKEIFIEELTFSLAIENPQLLVTDTIAMLNVQPLTESPDLVSRILYSDEKSSLQLSGVVRRLGLITPGGNRVKRTAWGANFSGTHQFTEHDEGYTQIIVGDGIGSYKGIPDVVSDGISRGGLLPVFGWMVGWNHRWTEKLQSNAVYSENILGNPSYQPGDELHRNTYLATNVIWSPVQHYFMGVEYLYGIRQNVDGQSAAAHRLQASFGFFLP